MQDEAKKKKNPRDAYTSAQMGYLSMESSCNQGDMSREYLDLKFISGIIFYRKGNHTTMMKFFQIRFH